MPSLKTLDRWLHQYDRIASIVASATVVIAGVACTLAFLLGKTVPVWSLVALAVVGVMALILVTWCVTGQSESTQAEKGSAAAGVLATSAAVPSVAIEPVGAPGVTATRSGPELISGLATIGGAAMGGIALSGILSGGLAIAAVCRGLRDKPSLPEAERQARLRGRQGAFLGAAVGLVGSAFAVGTSGVRGYSGAGISSGLVAIGRLSGGGKARGLSTTTLLPALLAALFAWAIYKPMLRRAPSPPARLPKRAS